jgi:nitrogen fixation NifU-like protein
MARGMTLEDAVKISRNDVAKELGGLPPQKMHCSNLAADALKLAIENYHRKLQGLPPRTGVTEGEEEHEADGGSCSPDEKPVQLK